MKQFFTRCLLIFSLFLPSIALTKNQNQQAYDYFSALSPTEDERGFLNLFEGFRSGLGGVRKNDATQLTKMSAAVRLMEQLAKHLTATSHKHALTLIAYAKQRLTTYSPRPGSSTTKAARKRAPAQQKTLADAINFLRQKQFELESAGLMLAAYDKCQAIKKRSLARTEKIRLITIQLEAMRAQLRKHTATTGKSFVPVQNAFKRLIKSIENCIQRPARQPSSTHSSQSKKATQLLLTDIPKHPSARRASAPSIPRQTQPPEGVASATPSDASSSNPKASSSSSSTHSKRPAITSAANEGELQAALAFLRTQETSKSAKLALSEYNRFIATGESNSTKAAACKAIEEALQNLKRVSPVTTDLYKKQQAISLLLNIMKSNVEKTSKPASARLASPTREPSPRAQPERKHSAAPAAGKSVKTPRTGTIIVPITGRASIVPPLKTSPTTGSPKSVRIATGAVRKTDADGTQHNTARDVHVYALTDRLQPHPKSSLASSNHRTATPTKSALTHSAPPAAPRAPSVKPTTQGAALGAGRPSVQEVRHVRVPGQSGVDCAFHAAKNALAIGESLASHNGVFDLRNVTIPSAEVIRKMKTQFVQQYRPRRDALDGREVAQLLMSIFESTQDTDVTSFLLEAPAYVCAEIDFQTQKKLSDVINKEPTLQAALVAAHDTPLTAVAQAAQSNKNLVLVWQRHKGESARDTIGHWFTILVARSGIFVFDSLNRNNLPTNFKPFLRDLKKYPVDAAQAVAAAIIAQ